MTTQPAREQIAKLVETALGVFPEGMKNAEMTDGVSNLAWLTADAILALPASPDALRPSAPASVAGSGHSRYHFTDEASFTVQTVEGMASLGKGWLAISEAEYAALAAPASDGLRAEVPIDSRTGRPIGDHGTAEQAIAFALDAHSDTLQTYEFLEAWRDGDLDEWPEFYPWLAALDQPQSGEGGE